MVFNTLIGLPLVRVVYHFITKSGRPLAPLFYHSNFTLALSAFVIVVYVCIFYLRLFGVAVIFSLDGLKLKLYGDFGCELGWRTYII